MSQEKVSANGEIVLLALGGNATSTAGSARETLLAALVELQKRFGDVHSSRLYKTPAFPVGSGPDFVNAACLFRTQLDAQALLADLHAIEQDFGRTRTRRWGQRTLDLDLIAFGQAIAPDAATQTYWRTLAPDDQQTRTPDTLILPHPRVQDRPFVLVPLGDIAAGWTHPVLGQTVTQMIATHSDHARAQIVPIE